MYELTQLNDWQINLCENTISSNTFYMLVGDALLRNESLSVVRMGDGEVRLFQDVSDSDGVIVPTKRHDREWLRKLGLLGIPKRLLKQRMLQAANECTYFAPSISGIWRQDYNNHGLSKRKHYVDNFFVNSWTEEMIVNLFKAAGHVLLIHGSAEPADAMQIRAKKIGVKVSYLKLTNWEESDTVVGEAHKINAPLVLFSAGPASKYIGAEIGGVTLDLGNSVDRWTLSSLA
jgi:hypothetical protein